MNLQPTAKEPVFSYVCKRCGITTYSHQNPPWADLDGKPFEDYYCDDNT